MYRWCRLEIEGGFEGFLLWGLQICFLMDLSSNQFQKFNIFMSKISLKSSKIYQKRQIYILTDHGLIWVILKVTKFVTKVWKLRFFVVCFWICIRGVGFKLRRGFCVFYFLRILGYQLFKSLFRIPISRSNILMPKRSLQSPKS